MTFDEAFDVVFLTAACVVVLMLAQAYGGLAGVLVVLLVTGLIAIWYGMTVMLESFDDFEGEDDPDE
jgi:hypothetical protein